ncbi:Wadjet anti-phage system protein JetA family protein [Rhodovibrio salinarum]|uniref:Uncharacterized protein n=1 Tax=Rhodovibrio salinarum TaxID=1087 RepID=A0A934V1R3_9PROT|nr:Wadjet anti-phage system protein JetA family protein [Rhodovibrio salinarum]MBK1698294.1 hypothetical protein [Rhodovibrio salinarum]
MTGAEASNGTDTLFGKLPDRLFQLFAGRNRHFFADLLEFLDDEVFGYAGEVIRKTDVLASIGEFIARSYRDIDLSDEPVESDPSARERRDADQNRYRAFARLVETGWLTVHRDRYRPIVDFDPDARLLLQTLLDIKNERVRSYGGEVVKVKALLDSAMADPHTQSENVRNAARSARGFMNHLRTVTGRMRKIEDALIRQTNVRDLFGVYFQQHVTEHVIADYKRLNTRENPFRFRMQILDTVQDVVGDPVYLTPWAEAYAREGRARDTEEGEAHVVQDLQDIVRVFEALDDNMQIIQDTQARIERRIRNAIQFRDRIEDARTGNVLASMKALAQAELPDDALVRVRHGFLHTELPVGPEHLYQQARKHGPAERDAIRDPEPDPAEDAYEQALELFQARAQVTSEKLAAYAEAALGERDWVRGSELSPVGLDDFFAFERLSEINVAFDGLFAEHYEVEFTGERAQNVWLTFPDFILRRRRVYEHATPPAGTDHVSAVTTRPPSPVASEGDHQRWN